MSKSRTNFVVIPVQQVGKGVKEAFGIAAYDRFGEIALFEGVFDNGDTLYYRPSLQKWHSKQSDASFMIIDKVLQELSRKKISPDKIPNIYHRALGL